LLNRNQPRVKQDSILVSDKSSIKAACWYYKRSDIFQLGPEGELSYGFGYEDSKNRALSISDLVGLIYANAGTGKVIFICNINNYIFFKDWLPKPLFEDISGPRGYVFTQY